MSGISETSPKLLPFFAGAILGREMVQKSREERRWSWHRILVSLIFNIIYLCFAGIFADIAIRCHFGCLKLAKPPKCLQTWSHFCLKRLPLTPVATLPCSCCVSGGTWCAIPLSGLNLKARLAANVWTEEEMKVHLPPPGWTGLIIGNLPMLLILRGFNQSSRGVYNTWNPFVLYFGGWTLQNKVELPIKTRVMWVPGICFFFVLWRY